MVHSDGRGDRAVSVRQRTPRGGRGRDVAGRDAGRERVAASDPRDRGRVYARARAGSPAVSQRSHAGVRPEHAALARVRDHRHERGQPARGARVFARLRGRAARSVAHRAGRARRGQRGGRAVCVGSVCDGSAWRVADVLHLERGGDDDRDEPGSVPMDALAELARPNDEPHRRSRPHGVARRRSMARLLGPSPGRARGRLRSDRRERVARSANVVALSRGAPRDRDELRVGQPREPVCRRARRGYYLFVTRTDVGPSLYHRTSVLYSTTPDRFAWAPITELWAHCAEIIRDGDRWYITSGGWTSQTGERWRGLLLAPLRWMRPE